MTAMPTIPRYTTPYGRHRRIVVVGGVAAGPAAAAKAARTDPDAEVVLFERGTDISYGTCEMPYLISGEVENPDHLVFYSAETLERDKRVRVHLRHEVREIRAAQRELVVADLTTGIGRIERYDRLILATGSRAKSLPVFPPALENVFPLTSLDHARAILSFLGSAQPRRAVIVGAGFIGVELAEVLAGRGVDVTLISDAPDVLPTFDPEIRALAGRLITERGIRFLPGSPVVDVKSEAGRIRAIRTASEVIETDCVFVAAGIIANAELAREARIRVGSDGGILTDARQMTSIDGIYAAGDCAEVMNLVTGRHQLQPFAALAARTGRIAGENAAGGSAALKGTVPLAALAVFGHEIVQTGCTVEECARHGIDAVHASVVASTRVPIMPGARTLLVAMTAERRTGRMVGASLIGAEHAAQRANTVALAIRQRMTIDEFLETDFLYTPRLAPLWDPLLVCAEKLRKALQH